MYGKVWNGFSLDFVPLTVFRIHIHYVAQKPFNTLRFSLKKKDFDEPAYTKKTNWLFWMTVQ